MLRPLVAQISADAFCSFYYFDFRLFARLHLAQQVRSSHVPIFFYLCENNYNYVLDSITIIYAMALTFWITDICNNL